MSKQFSTCTIADCQKPFVARVNAIPACAMHYMRFKRYGTIERRSSINSANSNRFGGLRDYILFRDAYKCVTCGMTEQQHRKKWGRNLTVDHIDGNGRNSYSPNNDSDNLQTLCLSCHGKKDIVRRRKFSDFPIASQQKILDNLKFYQGRRESLC